ncbi:MAG: hypothetical protein IH583_07545, partial [Candidatus Aminicenantes bacterium]|nr:hypothetical protein [Candidatus Aminicenantes bacterium]
DNGTSWTEANSGLEEKRIHDLAVRGTDLLATTHSGVFRSVDNGVSWMAVDFPRSDLDKLLHPDPGNISRANDSYGPIVVSGSVILVGSGRPAFLSKDGGASWTVLGSWVADTSANALAVSGTMLLAGAGSMTVWPYTGGIYLSKDNGATWARTNSGLPENVSVSCLLVSGADLFAGTFHHGAFVSADNGMSWTSVGTGWPAETYCLCLAVHGGYLFGGSPDKGVWRLPLSEINHKKK